MPAKAAMDTKSPRAWTGSLFVMTRTKDGARPPGDSTSKGHGTTDLYWRVDTPERRHGAEKPPRPFSFPPFFDMGNQTV